MPSNIKLMMMWGNVREYATQASNFQKSSATQSTYLSIQLAAYQANSASMMKPISLSVASGGSSGTAHYESALSEHHFCGLDLAICCDTTIHIDLWKHNRLPPGYWGETTLIPKISKTNGFETDAVICSMIFCCGYQALTLEYLFTSCMCLYEPNQQEKYKVNLSRQMKRKTWRKKTKTATNPTRWAPTSF